MVSKEAVFLISVATEKFIERLTQASQRAAERQSRISIQERDICEHRHTSPIFFSNTRSRCSGARCRRIYIPLG